MKAYNNVLPGCEHAINAWNDLSFRTKLDHPSRVCEGFVIQDTMTNNGIILSIPGIIHDYAQQYIQENGLPECEMEYVHFIKYNKNEGYFSKHIDGMDRKFSAILYMNDVAEGGETRFYMPEGTYVVKPQAGKLIFFDAYLDHEATVPISDDKYICVTWFAEKK